MCNASTCPGLAGSEHPKDQLDIIIDCIQAVTDLMLPEGDMHLVRRDKLSTLMDFLSEHLQAVAGEVRHAD